MSKVSTSFKEVNNLGFDNDKTEELIAGLQKDGVVVGIEDLSYYLRKQGLIVEEHIGRRRNYVKVSPKLFGVDLTKKGNDVNEFFKQHMQMGKIRFIPEYYETKLVNIESTIRMQKKRNAVGYDSKFMLLDSYGKFMELVEVKKIEYFKVRDEIVANWDKLILRFKEILLSSLEELNAIDDKKVFTTIISRIPTKEEYAESFYMNVSAKAFPVTENLEMFTDDIQNQIKDGLNEETVTTLYEIIGNTLNDAFEGTCKVIKAIQKNDKIENKTLGSIRMTAKRIGEKNIFNNPKIEQIKQAVLEMLELSSDPGVMCEEAEIIASMIYGYALELKIENSIKLKNSPLSEEDLLSTFEMVGGDKASFNVRVETDEEEQAVYEKMRA